MQAAASPQASEDERTLWEMEHAYWREVEKNDRVAYANLWPEHFLGWPSVSPSPVHKNQITDWITNQTSKGLTFRSVEFKPAGNAGDRRGRGGVLLDHASLFGQEREWNALYFAYEPRLGPN